MLGPVLGVHLLNQDDELKNLQATVKELLARVEGLELALAKSSSQQDLPSGALSRPLLNSEALEPAVEVGSAELETAPLLALPLSELPESIDPAAPNASTKHSETKGNPPPLPSSFATNPESLETKIGLYWLSKLGMAFVVLGVALLIGYSFQYFGPIAKISTGFVVSALLLFAGEFIERKQKLPGYGQVLCGGAWSLAYFTSYAMHHIESVRVISDPVYGAIMMIAVAVCAAYHSFKKDSELVASLAVCLGYLTLSLSNLTIFSAVSSTVLTLILSFMVAKKKWATLYSSGLFSALAIMLLSIEPKLSSAPTPDLILYLAFLAPYVFAGGILPTVLKEDKAAARSGAAAINVTAATVATISLIHAFAKLSLPIDANALAFGVVSVTYAVFALFSRQRGCPDNALTNSLIALSTFTLFLPAANGKQPTLTAWSVELALLLFVGIKYELRSFRFFGLLLGLCLSTVCIVESFSTQSITVLGLTIPRAIPRILPAALVLAAGCYLFQTPRVKSVSNLSVREAALSFHWYAHCTGALLWLAIPGLIYFGKFVQGDAGDRMLVCCWAIEAFGLGLLSYLWKRPYFTSMSILGFLVTGISCFLPLVHHSLNWGVQLALLSYLTFKFRLRKDRTSAFAYKSYALIAALVMLSVPPNSADEFSAAVWSFELLCCAFLAFRWSDSFFKYLAILGSCWIFARCLFDTTSSWAEIFMFCGALVGAARLVSKSDLGILGEGKRSPEPSCMNVAAATALAAYIGNNLQNSLVSVGWAVEGVVLLAIGFAAKDKVLRICGLLSFALVILRLLFVDLSGANTVHRIIAFIVAGVLFMLAAYAYAWFNKRFEGEAQDAQQASTDPSDLLKPGLPKDSEQEKDSAKTESEKPISSD